MGAVGRAKPERARRLGRAFYERPTEDVARALIGKLLVHESDAGRTSGLIVETEAYLGEVDAASHSFPGRTARNAAMFGPPGHAYVYLIYGMHHCFNVVTRPAGIAEAVLVRALEPIEGTELMRRRRGARFTDRELCNGPGKLAQALDLSRAHNGLDLVRGAIGLFEWPRSAAGNPLDIAVGPRIGITRSTELPLRFYLRGNRHVSKT